MLIRASLLALGFITLTVAPAQGADDVLGKAGNLTYLRGSVTLEGSPSAPVSAEKQTKCPKGTHAVSGGATVKTATNRAIASTTKSTDRAWYGEGWQLDTEDSKLTVYAVCSSAKLKKISTVRDFHSAPMGPASVSATIPCETGHVVGGGTLAIGEGTSWLLNSSYPVDTGSDADTTPDDGWGVFARYTDSTQTGSFLVDGVCMKGPEPTYRIKFVEIAAGESDSVRATCGKDLRVIGGGGWISGDTAGARLTNSRPYDSGDKGEVPEDGWEASFVNTGAALLVARSYAICV